MQHLSAQERRRLLTALWPQLPAEISQWIVKQLDVRGLMTFARLSRGLNALVYSDDELWRDADPVPRAYAHGLMLANSRRKLIQRGMRTKSDECAPFVITLGSHHVDAGTAGDDMPAVVSPSLVCQTPRFGLTPQYYAGHEALVAQGTRSPAIKDKKIYNEEHVLRLIEQAFVSHPSVCPDEQPLLLMTSARTQISNRLLYECMERFGVRNIYSSDSETFALYSHGLTDGMVVDVGYECTTIVPVVEGALVATLHC